MNEWKGRWIDRQIDRQMDGWIDRQLDRRRVDHMDRQMKDGLIILFQVDMLRSIFERWQNYALYNYEMKTTW